jgi:orotidine-5'-phosphate decarboxylase
MMRDKDVYIAADFSSLSEMGKFLIPFYKSRIYPSIKIGLELWCSEGRDVLECLSPETPSIFLDLKLHDIPATIGRTISILENVPVDIVSIHSLGGRNMMLEAKRNADDIDIAGVTILTSMSEEQMWKMHIGQAGSSHISRDGMIMDLASQCHEAGIRYIVCSVRDVPIARRWYPQLKTFCPGIRLGSDVDHHDQKFVATPREAREAGADYIIVGRTITQSNDPEGTYKKIWEEFIDGK